MSLSWVGLLNVTSPEDAVTTSASVLASEKCQNPVSESSLIAPSLSRVSPSPDDIVNLDPSNVKPVWKTLKNEAHEIPFEDNYFDLVLFRGVMEHIPPNKQQISLNEIYRVMKTQGLGYFVIPPWYNPHAGHGLKPFHIFPFVIAKFLRNLFFKKKVKYNSLEEASLYKITFSQMKKMINLAGFNIVDMKDTHLRFHFLCKVPILREFLIPAVAFLVKK